MAKSAGSVIFNLRAAIPIAPSKHADQPAANNSSGLVPLPAVPGGDSLTSKRPSELRAAPSRPPVVWTFAVNRIFAGVVIGYSSVIVVVKLHSVGCAKKNSHQLSRRQ